MKRWIIAALTALLLMLSIPRDAPLHPVYRKIKVTVQSVYFHFRYARSQEQKRAEYQHEEEKASRSNDPPQPPRSRKLMEQMGENAKAKEEKARTFDDRLAETFDNWKKEE